MQPGEVAQRAAQVGGCHVDDGSVAEARRFSAPLVVLRHGAHLTREAELSDRDEFGGVRAARTAGCKKN